MKAQLNGLFGRVVEAGIAVFNEDGSDCTQIAGASSIYPIGSELSAAYQHQECIILTASDAVKIGLPVEDIDTTAFTGFEIYNTESDGQADVGIKTKDGIFLLQRGTDFEWSIPSSNEADAGDEDMQDAWCEKQSSELRRFIVALFDLDSEANKDAGIEVGMPEGFEVVFEPNSLLNGYAYRVAGNTGTVKIQCREVGGTGSLDEYITHKTMPRSEFDAWAKEVGLYDPYDDNPAKLVQLIQGDDPFYHCEE